MTTYKIDALQNLLAAQAEFMRVKELPLYDHVKAFRKSVAEALILRDDSLNLIPYVIFNTVAVQAALAGNVVTDEAIKDFKQACHDHIKAVWGK